MVASSTVPNYPFLYWSPLLIVIIKHHRETPQYENQSVPTQHSCLDLLQREVSLLAFCETIQLTNHFNTFPQNCGGKKCLKFQMERFGHAILE